MDKFHKLPRTYGPHRSPWAEINRKWVALDCQTVVPDKEARQAGIELDVDYEGVAKPRNARTKRCFDDYATPDMFAEGNTKWFAPGARDLAASDDSMLSSLLLTLTKSQENPGAAGSPGEIIKAIPMPEAAIAHSSGFNLLLRPG